MIPMIAQILLVALPLDIRVGVRDVKATSCEIVRLNVALGMTSQLIFDEQPTLTLHADEEHFKIRTNSDAKRTIAIIPFVDAGAIGSLFPSAANQGRVLLPSPRALAEKLDATFKTNLFVFFKNSNQLMFELRFVEKPKADYVLHVRQVFKKDCNL